MHCFTSQCSTTVVFTSCTLQLSLCTHSLISTYLPSLRRLQGMTARGKPSGSPMAHVELGQGSGASTAAASTTQDFNATAVAATAEPASSAASSTSTATAAQPSDTKPSGSRGHDAPAASSAPLGAGIHDMMEQLQSHLQLEQQKLEAREAHVQQQEARQKAEAARLAASGVRGQDVVELNVGGSIISTSRKTLCLVPDSLLEAMFRCVGASNETWRVFGMLQQRQAARSKAT